MVVSTLILTPLLGMLALGCEDDRLFTDAQGYYCTDWRGYNCDSAFTEWGYSEEETEDILENCCVTCSGETEDCKDDPDFVDGMGYSCGDWAGYSCYRVTPEDGYSVEQTKDLLNNCPFTCQSCDYDTEGEETCQDNFKFSDAYGFACGEWRDYDCNQAVEEYGYNDQEMHYILANCGFSCDSCGYADDKECIDDHEFVDEQGYLCDDWHGYDCKEAMYRWGYSWWGKKMLYESCPLTCRKCDSGFEDGCMDNKEFVDQDGYYCKDWYAFDCSKAETDWEYSSEAALDLLKNCPKTCDVCELYGEDSFDEESSSDDDKGGKWGKWGNHHGDSHEGKWSDNDGAQDSDDSHDGKHGGGGKWGKWWKHDSSSDDDGETKCKDDKWFWDEFGYRCEDWRGFVCEDAISEWEYSEEGQAKILDACKRSCGVCDGANPDCKNNYDFLDAQGYECADWEGYDCTTAVEEWGYSQTEMEDIWMNCRRTCRTCEDEQQEPEEPEEPEEDSEEEERDILTFEGFKDLCVAIADREVCQTYGCTYNKKKEKCTSKAAEKVKCKRIQDPFTCALVGCVPPEVDGEQCKGTPFGLE